MGQYYRAVVFEAQDYDKIDVYEPDGVKLMEHSWIGNSSVNAVLARIENNPCHVAWIGDYFDAVEVYDIDNTLYNMAALANSIPYRFLRNDLIPDYKPRKYLVNRSKKQYCELMCCPLCDMFGEEWQINPLPILTACGNGRGGGDYEGADMHLVGAWAGDIIESTDVKPTGYTYIEPRFEEN